MAATSAPRIAGRLPSLLRLPTLRPSQPAISLHSLTPGSQGPSSSRLFRISRLPSQLRCLASMLPLHSAIASARLTSVLSAESQSWGLIPQGISMPL